MQSRQGHDGQTRNRVSLSPKRGIRPAAFHLMGGSAGNYLAVVPSRYLSAHEVDYLCLDGISAGGRRNDRIVKTPGLVGRHSPFLTGPAHTLPKGRVQTVYWVDWPTAGDSTVGYTTSQRIGIRPDRPGVA
jgi:hypothetical protein